MQNLLASCVKTSKNVYWHFLLDHPVINNFCDFKHNFYFLPIWGITCCSTKHVSELKNVKILNYVLTHSKNLQPSSTLQVQIDDEVFQETAQGDGQYDAFMNALKKIYKKNFQNHIF